MPIMIEVRMSRADFNLADELVSAYDEFVAFTDKKTLSSIGIDIFTVFRKSPNPHWPTSNTEVFIKERF